MMGLSLEQVVGRRGGSVASVSSFPIHLMYDHIPYYTRPYHLFLVLSTTAASFPILILLQVTKFFHISLHFIPYESFIRRFMQLRTHITQRSLLFLSSIPSIPSSTSFFLNQLFLIFTTRSRIILPSFYSVISRVSVHIALCLSFHPPPRHGFQHRSGAEAPARVSGIEEGAKVGSRVW